MRPVDALARVNDALWERLDAFNGGLHRGIRPQTRDMRPMSAAWAEDALALFREKLAEGGSICPRTVCWLSLSRLTQRPALSLRVPDYVSRGFVYVKEAEALMEELRTISQMALDRCSVENLRDWNSLKSAIKGDVSDYLFKKTKRSPMVLPIIMEI